MRRSCHICLRCRVRCGAQRASIRFQPFLAGTASPNMSKCSPTSTRSSAGMESSRSSCRRAGSQVTVDFVVQRPRHRPARDRIHHQPPSASPRAVVREEERVHDQTSVDGKRCRSTADFRSTSWSIRFTRRFRSPTWTRTSTGTTSGISSTRSGSRPVIKE